MSDDDLKAELERLRNKNAALKKGVATGITRREVIALHQSLCN
jgi:hypothetical protein